jgi:hypothetical protein
MNQLPFSSDAPTPFARAARGSTSSGQDLTPALRQEPRAVLDWGWRPRLTFLYVYCRATKCLLRGRWCGALATGIYSRDDLVRVAAYASPSPRHGWKGRGGIRRYFDGAERVSRCHCVAPGSVCGWVLSGVSLFCEKNFFQDPLRILFIGRAALFVQIPLPCAPKFPPLPV